MWIPFVLVCLLVGPGAPSQASSNFHQIWKGIHEDIKANPVLQHALLERLQLVTSADSDFNPQFNCEIITSDTPPTTVDDLMPGDINMIAAMGDSVTAGHGITFDVATPTPSRSWSIGGKGSLDTGFISLPNILRKYNPDLVGYSSGSILPSNWGFNVANAGDIARDIPGQAEKLVDKMMNGGEGDFNNDWKLITLLIGGNDLCHYCEDEVLHSPAQYTAYIAEALDVLYQKVPRTVVNMVAMSDITPLTDYSTNWFCSFVQKQICPCATNAASKQQLRQIQLAYYEHLVELMESGRYDDKDDFRVILQPTMVDLVPPTDPETGEPDASWLSTDCFHPNEKAHHFLAVNLWNSMLIPVGEKPRRAVVDLSDPQYLCPTKQQPYFYTPLNINIRKKKKVPTATLRDTTA